MLAIDEGVKLVMGRVLSRAAKVGMLFVVAAGVGSRIV